MKHDHRTSLWILAGGYMAWCYRCGAIRKLQHRDGSLVFAEKRWTLPTGKEGHNPAMASHTSRRET